MTITYRSLSEFEQGRVDVAHVIQEQFEKWLQDDPIREPRRIAVHEIESNSITTFPPKYEVTYLERKEKDGAKTFRARLIENKQDNEVDQRWTSSYTLHLPGKIDQRGFFLFEIDSPLETLKNGSQRPINASSPRFMRRLLDLDALQLRDGEFAIMENGPKWLDVEEVDYVIDIACDPSRRGALVLVGTDASRPAQSYMEFSKKSLERLAGLATSFILSPEATERFNSEIGQYHAVYPGAIRTYFPEVDPATDFDDRRHPFIKKDRLAELDGRIVASTLENSARRMTLESALPNSVTRVLERINADLKALELKGPRKFVSDLAGSSEITFSDADTKVIEVIEKSTLVADQKSNFLEIEARLCKALNVDELSVEMIDSYIARVNQVQSLTPLLEQSLQDNSELRMHVERIQNSLTESEMDHLETFAEKESLQSQINYLKDSLSSLTSQTLDGSKLAKLVNEIIHANISWVGRDQNLTHQNPQSFTEILLSLKDLSYLEFTGDWEEIESLDKDEIGIYSGKTWEGLQVLNDYARAKIDGHDVKGIKEYLENAPSGYNNRWSIGKYASKESDSTENNSKLMNQRIFPVPTSVNPTGLELMGAHLKVSHRLRVHFFEDVPRTKKIYIGYIGKHLDTPRTN